MEDVKLTDLIDRSILQNVQDSFAEYTGVATLITDEQGVAITEESNFSKFCREIVRGSLKGKEECEKCSRMGVLRCVERGRPSVFDCCAGLIEFCVPIKVEGRIVGIFIGGQVRTQEKSEAELREIAKTLQLDEAVFLEETDKIKIMSRDEVVRNAVFLRRLAGALSDMAYQNYLAMQASRMLEETANARTHYMEGLYTDIAHDITEWKSQVETVLDSGEVEEQERLLKEMRTRGQDVLTFIRDTLVSIRLTNKSLNLKESVYGIKELMGEVADFLEPFYAQKENVLKVRIDSGVPAYLYGDKDRIYRILTALLYEAGKNIKKEEILFAVEAGRREYAALLEFRIEYRNPGCEKVVYDHIFEYMQKRGYQTEQDVLGNPVSEYDFLNHALQGGSAAGREAGGPEGVTKKEQEDLRKSEAENLPENKSERLTISEAESVTENKAESVTENKAESLTVSKAESLPISEAESLPESKAECSAQGEPESLTEKDAEYLIEHLIEKAAMQSMDEKMRAELSMVDILLGQLFGGLQIVCEPEQSCVCGLSFPQLDAKKQES